jgi:hypothetical protein
LFSVSSLFRGHAPGSIIVPERASKGGQYETGIVSNRMPRTNPFEFSTDREVKVRWLE